MPSPSSTPAPVGEPRGRAALDDLIRQARRLRGGVEAVRHGDGVQDAGARGRWERALCELAVAELDEVGHRLCELRAGAEGGAGAGTLPSGSAQWNLLTDEVVWSAELFALFGRSDADGPLSLDELPSWVLAEDQPALTGAVTDTLVDGSPLDVEFRVVRPDGGVRTLHMAGEPEPDPEGDTACLWAVLRDVSDLRSAERAAREDHEGPAGSADPAAEVRAAVLPRHRPGNRGGRPGRQALETATHYFAAEHSTLVGGAWFDALALPGEETMLSVGELTGNGVAAVSGMAMLLGAVRGMALAGVAPGPLMGHLDELLATTAQPALRGAVCARYAAASGLLTWSQAGPCAPLLFRRGTARRLDVREGAVPQDGTGHRQGSTRLEPGDVLVLHTEGLTAAEPGAGPVADRLSGLGPLLGAAATAQEALQAVMSACTDARDQDAGVLVARMPG
jgi:PAS domain-containing protein